MIIKAPERNIYNRVRNRPEKYGSKICFVGIFDGVAVNHDKTKR